MLCNIKWARNYKELHTIEEIVYEILQGVERAVGYTQFENCIIGKMM